MNLRVSGDRGEEIEMKKYRMASIAYQERRRGSLFIRKVPANAACNLTVIDLKHHCLISEVTSFRCCHPAILSLVDGSRSISGQIVPAGGGGGSGVWVKRPEPILGLV